MLGESNATYIFVRRNDENHGATPYMAFLISRHQPSPRYAEITAGFS